jgi:glutamate decarboxylase
MVHLGRVLTDKDLSEQLVPGLEGLDLGAPLGEDEFTASVYGSRYAAQDLPKHEMPNDEMPREVAYRMIK